MLTRRGHAVEMIGFDNEAISGARAQAAAAISSLYSRKAYSRVMSTLAAFRPDVLHVHNFLPTLSPSVFFAANEAHVPVVQTLHNYRLICANAQLFREGGVCEQCVEAKSFLPGIRHACYRGSRAGSAVVGGTMALHARLGTWSQRVTRYVALSDFAAAKLGEFRVPRDKIRVKPNFVEDRGSGTGAGGHALFVGRLSPEKGLATLIEADQQDRFVLPVHIAGDGPMRPVVEEASRRPGSQLRFLGPQTSASVQELMKQAALLLVPSLWYEGFPMVIVEALSFGLPVIASGLGGLPEFVEDGVCGLLHQPGRPDALAEALASFANMPQAERVQMRHAARDRYLQRYAEATNYGLLAGIYREAIEATLAKRA